MTHSTKKERKGFECPLSACPRTFHSGRSARNHCRSAHQIDPEAISEFKRSYDRRENQRQIPATSLGNSVDFDYIIFESCGECKTRPERRLGESEVVFCSSDCRSKYFTGPRHPAWKENTRPGTYGPCWEEKRDKRIARDDHQCVVCGVSQDEHYKRYRADLHVHHIIPRREFTSGGETDWKEANQLSNLVTLCNSCHPKYEERPPEFFESILEWE